MGCGLLCPCFYRKRKATAHTVLSKEPNSSESITICTYIIVCYVLTYSFLGNFKYVMFAPLSNCSCMIVRVESKS